MIDLVSLNARFAVGVFDPSHAVSDDGTDKYAGTVKMQASADAVGTFTIELILGEFPVLRLLWADQRGVQFPFDVVENLTVTVVDPARCGCDVPSPDTDGDGTADCNDQCPDDPGKAEPGACGCGVPDTDADGDEVADCVDNCPADFNPNQVDSNGDGAGDACDHEMIPTTTAWGLLVMALLLLVDARLRFGRARGERRICLASMTADPHRDREGAAKRMRIR